MTSPHDNDTRQSVGDRIGRYLDLYLGGIAAFLLFVLMILTFVDVAGRSVFNAPLPGGYEITELIMGVLIFAGLPVVSWREEHITIDLLDGVTPASLVSYRDIMVNVVSTVVVGFICWQTWMLAVQLWDDGELTEFLQVPVAPVMYMIGGLSGITTLALAANVVRHVLRRQPPHSAEPIV